jgi:hypothetical protein
MSEPLSVVCWKWKTPSNTISTKKRVEFISEDVNRLYKMLQKNLHIDFRLLCVTDDPIGINKEVKIIPIWDEFRDKGGCFVRLGAFRRDIDKLFGPRFLSIDLDCVVTGDVTPLFTRTEDFIIWGDHGGSAKYCGSLWMMNSGCRPQVYESFNPDDYQIVDGKYKGGTDQQHISRILHDEVLWTKKDGIYAFRNPSNGRRELPIGAKIVFFNGFYHPRETTVQNYYKWIRPMYTDPVEHRGDSSPVNIICFYWVGEKDSGWEDKSLAAKYINRLYASVKRNTTIPFKFTCFIREGLIVDNVNSEITIKYFDAPTWKGRLPKLYAFAPENGLTGRVVIMDLDLIITGNLDQVLLYGGKFMTRSEPRVNNISGGDIIFFEAGRYTFWSRLNKDTKRIINETRGNERFFYRKMFDRRMDFLQTLYPNSFMSYKVDLRKTFEVRIPAECKFISCHGHPKPHELEGKTNWLEAYWHE